MRAVVTAEAGVVLGAVLPAEAEGVVTAEAGVVLGAVVPAEAEGVVAAEPSLEELFKVILSRLEWISIEYHILCYK